MHPWNSTPNAIDVSPLPARWISHSSRHVSPWAGQGREHKVKAGERSVAIQAGIPQRARERINFNIATGTEAFMSPTQSTWPLNGNHIVVVKCVWNIATFYNNNKTHLPMQNELNLNVWNLQIAQQHLYSSADKGREWNRKRRRRVLL